jgi:hypothetical protein
MKIKLYRNPSAQRIIYRCGITAEVPQFSDKSVIAHRVPGSNCLVQAIACIHVSVCKWNDLIYFKRFSTFQKATEQSEKTNIPPLRLSATTLFEAQPHHVEVR